MNVNFFKKLIFVSFFLMLTGCATYVSEQRNVVSVKGYGTVNMYKNHSKEQRRLLSMRASKIDAYRNLAEEIKGLEINGHTKISDMLVQSDVYETYVDAFIRGAKVKSMTAINADTYETTLELRLTPLVDFLNSRYDRTNRYDRTETSSVLYY